jgi:hypothetical protein
MNTAKVEQLKATSAAASAAHDLERNRLAALGLKSAERYELLKPLKTAASAAHQEYVAFTHGQIKRELDVIIRAGAPIRSSAARARSSWKAAKFAAQGI